MMNVMYLIYLGFLRIVAIKIIKNKQKLFESVFKKSTLRSNYGFKSG